MLHKTLLINNAYINKSDKISIMTLNMYKLLTLTKLFFGGKRNVENQIKGKHLTMKEKLY